MKIKLKPSIKNKWVKALRSGLYRKTSGQLCKKGKTSDCFCALGVLVNETDGFVDPNTRNNNRDTSLSAGLPTSWLFRKLITKKSAIQAKNSWSDLTLVYKGESKPIYEWNDSGVSFKKLADLIEEQL